MRKIRLKPTESYCQKYLYTKIMTSKCKIIKYKLNANIFFQIYFCSTFSVRIQKVKINWKGRRLFERRHSKNTIWCESTVFSYCKSLTNITIPNTVKKIGQCAFEGCSSLTNITIPNSVIEIEKCAFSRCSSLTNITIPNSVIKIDDGAFQGCPLPTNISIPKSVIKIGKGAFSRRLVINEISYGRSRILK